MNGLNLRVIEGRDSEPLFAGPDVLKLLFRTSNGMGHIYRKLNDHAGPLVNRVQFTLNPGIPVWGLTESDLHKLGMRSDKLEVKHC